MSVAGRNAVVVVRASLARTLLRLPSRRTGRTSSIDAQAWYALRCHRAHRWGASVAGLSSRGADADWHLQWGIEPQAFRPTSNDLSGRCNRGNRTLDPAVMAACSTQLSYIAVGLWLRFARYTRAAALPRASVVENHSRWRQTLTKTSVTMRTHGAHRNSLRAERHRCAAQRLSSLVVMTIGSIEVSRPQTAVLESLARTTWTWVIATQLLESTPCLHVLRATLV